MFVSKFITELLITALFICIIMIDSNHFVKKTNGQFVNVGGLDKYDIVMLYSIWFIVSLIIWFC